MAIARRGLHHAARDRGARPVPIPPMPRQPAPRVALSTQITPAAVERRWQLLSISRESREALLDAPTLDALGQFRGSIENCIGALQMPVGLAGPLRIEGVHAHGDYYLPLATTEAALVASYSRGAQLIAESGGCAALVLAEGIGRSPGFAFASLREAARFAEWALSQRLVFNGCVAATTSHGRLKEMRAVIEGNHVYLHLDFTTGDAAGQNMVTLATEAICAHILAESPVQPNYWFLEANYSGDKKASARSFVGVRGRRVSAEVTIPAELVRRRLHTTPERMSDYFSMGALGGVLSGTLGAQGHYANGLAALYLATGQDVACVAESAVGVTRMEVNAAGDLYAAVTLPSIIVGTVGGGTNLPGQRACLELMGLAGSGHAAALAEVCAGLCLAGELSLIGALCAGHFASAHRKLARDVRHQSENQEGGGNA
ncbi:MAG TPA: hydroxymethylglutaryl-CoA reductase [Ktedonobacterales bacterium]|nr:hydroxymethylglutaryl-CoA reductase [Ktedonobacterales bacterium]